MLHELSPNIFNNKYSNINAVQDDDFVLIYNKNNILLKKINDEFSIPQKKDVKNLLKFDNITFAFSLNKNNCFIVYENIDLNDEYKYEDIFTLRYHKRKEIAWIGNVGHQLFNWYNDNKFCGKCGNKTHLKEDERAIGCDCCNNIVYPKISPAVIVAITCNDKILLAKGINRRINFYSLIAGFVEVGETFEEAVKREVKEETGLDVFNLKYYKSQPWPFSSSMMIGFFANADDKQKISIDTNELTEANWFTRNNLPFHSPDISIAGEMIEYFDKNGNY